MRETGKIEIKVAGLSITGRLNDSATAKEIFAKLPLTGSVNTWGNEIYFSSEIAMPPSDDARDVVQMGEIGYWPPGKAFCLFFGLTPISSVDEIRATSPVNIIGMIEGDIRLLKKAKDGDLIEVFRAE